MPPSNTKAKLEDYEDWKQEKIQNDDVVWNNTKAIKGRQKFCAYQLSKIQDPRRKNSWRSKQSSLEDSGLWIARSKVDRTFFIPLKDWSSYVILVLVHPVNMTGSKGLKIWSLSCFTAAMKRQATVTTFSGMPYPGEHIYRVSDSIW